MNKDEYEALKAEVNDMELNRDYLLSIAKPILFNTEMVRAISEDRKTETRRCIKPQPTYSSNDGFSWKGTDYGTDLPPTIKGAAYNFLCVAPYKPGDILYVRETFIQAAAHIFWYKADNKDFLSNCKRWKPSIHMPKEAARIFLKVTDVRVERLQEMDGQDVLKEGINSLVHPDAFYFDMNQLEMFEKLWNSTIKKSDIDTYGWDANPYVWVIEFERI